MTEKKKKANFILKYETLYSFLLKSGIRRRHLLSALLLNILLEVLDSRQEKEMNDIEFGKKKQIAFFFEDYMMCTYKTL